MEGSLIFIKIDGNSEKDASDAIDILRTRNEITKVDLVIANAEEGDAHDAAEGTPLWSLTDNFRVNTGGHLLLFQAFRPLLLAAASSTPKFVVLSHAIARFTDSGVVPLKPTAYRASKAAANFIAQRIHVEEEWLISLPICPG